MTSKDNPHNFTITMCTFTSLLPLALTVTTLILAGYSVTATVITNVAREVKGNKNIQAQSTVVTGSYIVRLDDKASAAKVKSIASGTAATMQSLKKQLIANGTLIATSNDVVNVRTDRIFTKSVKAFLIKGVSESMVSSLRKATGVVSVQPDTIVYIDGKVAKEGTVTVQDLPIPQQGNREMQAVQTTPWGVQRIGGPIDLNTVPNPNGKIFIIDSGISTKTNDLIIDKTLSINFVGTDQGSSPAGWEDDVGHGTHVAGTIAALNNGINVVGVVPGATVVAIKVCSPNGCLTSDIIAGLEHVYINGKKGDVVNLSLGGPMFFVPDVTNAAVESIASLGIKFAISAGNEADDATNYSPASAFGTNIYTVSCYDKSNTLCSFSNYGDVVDVGGPGLDILSLSLNGGVISASGTSMSAPHIAGLLFANSFTTNGYVKGDKDLFPDPIFVYAGVVPPPVPPPSNDLLFILRTDFWTGTETSWNLTRILPAPPTVVAYRPIGTYPSGPTWTSAVSNLAVGSYRFDLYDKSGDGLSPPAYYILTFDNGVVLKSGGTFTNVDTTFFSVTSPAVEGQSVTVTTTKTGTAPFPNTAPTPTPVAPVASPVVKGPNPVARKTQKPKSQLK